MSNTLLNPPGATPNTTLPDVEGKPNQPVRFGDNAGFLVALRERTNKYFEENGLAKRDLPRMYFKTFVILSWFVASYVLLVFAATALWQTAALIVSLALAMSAIGFCVQHDGGHGAYSDKRWVNNVMAMTLDMLGGSSYVWKRKHNQIHHSYTNITGHDDDIDVGIFGRLSPHQPRYWFHRIQHVYLWALYGFLPLKWQFFDDFSFYATKEIAGHRCKRPRGKEALVFWGGKVVFASWAVVLPMFFHEWYFVLGAIFATTFVQGVILSVVFQLAHVVEDADFPMPEEATGRIENEWAIHQVETTVDFARTSHIVNWFTGGLNYQIEHHLFPQICHLHYPELSKIVEETSKEFGVRYTAHQTLGAAVASHYRLLKSLGQAA
ncbi:MAG: fatty acid desaturase [Planctomycetaceae bacterium]